MGNVSVAGWDTYRVQQTDHVLRLNCVDRLVFVGFWCNHLIFTTVHILHDVDNLVLTTLSTYGPPYFPKARAGYKDTVFMNDDVTSAKEFVLVRVCLFVSKTNKLNLL